MKAVILLSGGLDSTVCMACAKEAGYELYPISFDYHQRHNIELESAKKVAEFYQVAKHIVIETNMNVIGGSALTDTSIDVPDGDIKSDKVPVTYVPARNLIFLSYALSYAEAIGAERILIGVNALDYSGYPDCRPAFIEQFQQVANYATKAAAVDKKEILIETPLLNLSKKEIVELGTKLGAPLHVSHSCYRGGEKACGVCDSCQLRLKGFREAGIVDPVEYETDDCK
ncbi:MAG: 7-cyano-7-deazaguanine synthase QueC [Selenomonadales bacterium]|nr:7-cyano-7-deazaguanine synthase QueC [Selenomonadales bacterium]MBQ5587719.1 7-cyano-7-deazaguanine synthase QueC [Selenomonadales bacterium]MBQ5636908.1 7-cyano-7-deazaguanine synthase QueC [Selenomonadales bacterium]